MHAQNYLRRLSLLLLFLFLSGGLLACTASEGDGPRAWIDFPRDGATVPAGASVVVISHAYAPDGVAEVLLLVNGEAYRRDTPGEAGTTLGEVRQPWFPEAAGLYTLQVRTYDTTGAVSNPSTISVRVGGEITEAPLDTPTVTTVPEEPAPLPVDTVTPTSAPPTSTATATPTSVPPTATATATALPPLPTATPTSPPPPPTYTPTAIPQAEVAFWVDQDSLTAGECTTLRWDVEFATAVFLDGAGVVGQGTQSVCPADTTTYNLHVQAASGNVDRAIIITVSAPVDTTPPPAPQLMVPADGLQLSCRLEQVLNWIPSSDESGIAGYYIKLERQVTANLWNTVREWGPVVDKQTEAEVQCGGIYRWAVRALDGAGNLGNWSPWSYFTVTLD